MIKLHPIKEQEEKVSDKGEDISTVKSENEEKIINEYNPKLDNFSIWFYPFGFKYDYNFQEHPLIILDNMDYTDSEIGLSLDEIYPEIVSGTSQVEKYPKGEYDNLLKIGLQHDNKEDNKKEIKENHLTRPTIFDLMNTQNKVYYDMNISLQDILDNGRYKGKLSDKKIKELKEKANNYLDYVKVESLQEDINSNSINDFINALYELRQKGISEKGEFSLENLVFKEFRNLGYLDNLKELAKEERSKELSLEQLNETK